MIELKINNGCCSNKSKGSRLECASETIVGFIALTELLASATHTSFEHAALFMYQQGVTAKRKTEEMNSEKES